MSADESGADESGADESGADESEAEESVIRSRWLSRINISALGGIPCKSSPRYHVWTTRNEPRRSRILCRIPGSSSAQLNPPSGFVKYRREYGGASCRIRS
jgi:hypothetical protein